MQLRILKILLIILILLYHSLVFSKTNENKNFNHRYLSSYFSAQVSHQNGDNGLAIKYFLNSTTVVNLIPSMTKCVHTLSISLHRGDRKHPTFPTTIMYIL